MPLTSPPRHGGTTRKGSTAAVIVGFVVLWMILDRSAAGSGSFRGDYGVAVCLAVLAAAVVVEMLISGVRPRRALEALGVSRLPERRALLWAATVCVAMLTFYPAFALLTGTSIALRPDWYLLVAGLFAQGGIAEETVFRGFLFRHFREGRPFWRAAGLAAIPFVAVHLLLFLTLDFALAAASVILAVCLSFPLAWLFERGGNSIWPPAIIHFVVQGSIKLVEVDLGILPAMAIVWIALSAVVPWVFFLIRARPR